jgi:hypothetical protein
MGYLSNFYIKFENLNEFSEEEQEEILDEIVGNIDFIENYLSDDEFYNNSEITAYQLKWYEYEDDLIKISERFPELKFKVDVYGENDGDIVRIYFYNGECQREKGIIGFRECLLW